MSHYDDLDEDEIETFELTLTEYHTIVRLKKLLNDNKDNFSYTFGCQTLSLLKYLERFK